MSFLRTGFLILISDLDRPLLSSRVPLFHTTRGCCALDKKNLFLFLAKTPVVLILRMLLPKKYIYSYSSAPAGTNWWAMACPEIRKLRPELSLVKSDEAFRDFCLRW